MVLAQQIDNIILAVTVPSFFIIEWISVMLIIVALFLPERWIRRVWNTSYAKDKVGILSGVAGLAGAVVAVLGIVLCRIVDFAAGLF